LLVGVGGLREELKHRRGGLKKTEATLYKKQTSNARVADFVPWPYCRSFQ